MPRPLRVAVAGTVYHVFNRANARMTIFESDGDYGAFENVLTEARRRMPMRILSYELMPNHWHFVLWPVKDQDLSEFMHWLTVTHTQRWHAAHGTAGTGHIYQGRFKSFPVQSDRHYLSLCRYVERNALAAGLVNNAGDWRWGSLWRRTKGDAEARSLLSEGPMPWPEGWIDLVNQPQNEKEQEKIELCLLRGRPFGNEQWVDDVATRLGLGSTLRSRGRPKKGSGTFLGADKPVS